MSKPDTQINSICIYCGSHPGSNPEFVKAAHALGASMATAGLQLVYGGGDQGLMGAAARGVLENGGKVTGVIPEFLLGWEYHEGASDLVGVEMIVVPDMHTRKHQMFEKADAFVALPGGIGTLEELVEMMTWAQLARHEKPIALLNTDGFWSPLITLLDHMNEQKFVHNPELVRLRVVDEPDDVIAALQD